MPVIGSAGNLTSRSLKVRRLLWEQDQVGAIPTALTISGRSVVVSAPVWGTGNRECKSRRPDHLSGSDLEAIWKYLEALLFGHQLVISREPTGVLGFKERRHKGRGHSGVGVTPGRAGPDPAPLLEPFFLIFLS